jgi:hypothetical protein
MVIALLVAMLIGLTACGSEDSKNKKDEESTSGPEAVVQDYFEYIGNLKFSKAFKLIDWAAYSMIENEDYDYDEIEDEYEEYIETNEDDINDLEDYVDDLAVTLEEEIENYGKYTITVNNVEDAEKVEGTKNIYVVEIEVAMKIETDDDVEENTDEYDVFVMKNGNDYYIIGGIDEFMEAL